MRRQAGEGGGHALGGTPVGKVTIWKPDSARELRRYLVVNHLSAERCESALTVNDQADFRKEHHASKMVCGLI